MHKKIYELFAVLKEKGTEASYLLRNRKITAILFDGLATKKTWNKNVFLPLFISHKICLFYAFDTNILYS